MDKRKQLRKEKNKLHKEWREHALKRDNYRCVICDDEERVNVHHLISKSVIELKYDVKNALCLCSLHHLFHRNFSAHKGSLLFITWLMKNRKKQYNYLIKKLR